MKKLFILILLAFSVNANAQSFTYEVWDATEYGCKIKASTWYNSLTNNQQAAVQSVNDKNSSPQGQYGYESEALYDISHEFWYIYWVLMHPPIGPPTYENWLEQNQ